MTQEFINIGTLPNDGEGDPLRTAFQKINNNFSQLFSTTSNTSESYTVGPAANQVIYESPANVFTQGKFQINSNNTENQDSQNIILTVGKTTNNTAVKFTGYGTVFNGNAVARYDMDINNGNVRILCSPLSDMVLKHFIASDITWDGLGA
jgi:hypothetical protein